MSDQQYQQVAESHNFTDQSSNFLEVSLSNNSISSMSVVNLYIFKVLVGY